jgi:hypothetical protein
MTPMRTPSILLALVLSGVAAAQSAAPEGRPLALTATFDSGEACPAAGRGSAGLAGVPYRSGDSRQFTLDWCLDLEKAKSLIESRKREVASVASRLSSAIDRLTETIEAR